MRPEVVRRPATPTRVRAWTGDRWRDRPDRLATEEPMEIRIEQPGGDVGPLAVVMRTPGHDFELAVGFCITEGVIDAATDLGAVRYCLGPDAEQEYNVVTVAVRRPVDLDDRARSFAAGSSCGVCGKATLDQLEVDCAPIAPGPAFALDVLVAMPERLRAAQPLFDATGGLHGAALCDGAGEVVVVREDVGRHNAVDKLVGLATLEDRLPLAESALVVSGRASFEIVQKAARAGIPVVVAVSAPSSLAVTTARRLGMTLVGFVRDGRANVYTGPERVA
ncbi:MAG: formate dehydrogenase accessory sulfurtransferase FdhD [Acidimicrobiia bacterium]